MKHLAIPLGCLLFLLFGCQSARYVYRDDDRGVVAIPRAGGRSPGPSQKQQTVDLKHREKALALMNRHFPDGFIIESEGEVVSGQAAPNDNTASDIQLAKHVDMPVGGDKATPKAETEWQIRYRRKPTEGDVAPLLRTMLQRMEQR